MVAESVVVVITALTWAKKLCGVLRLARNQVCNVQHMWITERLYLYDGGRRGNVDSCREMLTASIIATNLFKSSRLLPKFHYTGKSQWVQNSLVARMGESWPIDTESIVPQLLYRQEGGRIPAKFLTSQEAGRIPGWLLTSQEAGRIPGWLLTSQEAGRISAWLLTSQEGGRIPVWLLTSQEGGGYSCLTPHQTRRRGNSWLHPASFLCRQFK